MPPVDRDRRACAAKLYAAWLTSVDVEPSRTALARVDQALVPIGAGVLLVVRA
jgi:hypothetical protein